MKAWPYEVSSYTKDEVVVYCVEDVNWQTFRMSLKGLSTPSKLARLRGWLETGGGGGGNRATRVQVDNYINALKRGGQLNLQGEVQR